MQEKRIYLRSDRRIFCVHTRHLILILSQKIEPRPADIDEFLFLLREEEHYLAGAECFVTKE